MILSDALWVTLEYRMVLSLGSCQISAFQDVISALFLKQYIVNAWELDLGRHLITILALNFVAGVVWLNSATEK